MSVFRGDSRFVFAHGGRYPEECILILVEEAELCTDFPVFRLRQFSRFAIFQFSN